MSDLSPTPVTDCGCPEGASPAFTMTRRALLGAAGAAGALGAMTSFAPAAEAATSLSFAEATYTGDTLVVLSFRGGMDGLSAVIPVGDPAYFAARPNIAVPASKALQLDSMFGFHPAMAPLLPLFKSGKLAAVHAVGQPNASRSHFADMEEMERAAPGSSLRTGWLDRMVGATGTGGTFSATAVGATSAPRSFLGPTVELALRSVDGFTLSGSYSDADLLRWTKALKALHAEGPSLKSTPADTALGAVATTAALKKAGYTPSGGAKYPSGDLGDALRDTARLIKAGVGLRAVTVDSGNWDMHVNLGGSDSGWMQRQLAEVASALAAFYTDLGTKANDVTLVTMSEFGRRVSENGSGGVDHGYGNVSLVMGGGVNGGKVYGRWPGLGAADLRNGDLAVTTDYRTMLAELVEKRCRLDGATVFPGVPTSRLGVAAPKS